MKLRVRVPATVANLGPGFDCLALAVDLWNEVTLDTEGQPGVRIDGEGSGELPEDESNLVVRAMARLGSDRSEELPPVSISCVNHIPLERGLGSSASAVVAGLLLADRVLGQSVPRSDLRSLLRLAVELEGHADNVAAALYGGLVLAYGGSDGWDVESLTPDPALRPVMLVPSSERVSTVEARRSLPAEVALRAAVFNSSRAALLVVALTSRPHLLGEALREDIHQERRLALAPASHAVFRRLVDAGVPVCVAGSGPSLLAFESDRATVPHPGDGWRIIQTRIASGATFTDER